MGCMLKSSRDAGDFEAVVITGRGNLRQPWDDSDLQKKTLELLQRWGFKAALMEEIPFIIHLTHITCIYKKYIQDIYI